MSALGCCQQFSQKPLVPKAGFTATSKFSSNFCLAVAVTWVRLSGCADNTIHHLHQKGTVGVCREY
jgi:hypothetical protein